MTLATNNQETADRNLTAAKAVKTTKRNQASHDAQDVTNQATATNDLKSKATKSQIDYNTAQNDTSYQKADGQAAQAATKAQIDHDAKQTEVTTDQRKLTQDQADLQTEQGKTNSLTIADKSAKDAVKANAAVIKDAQGRIDRGESLTQNRIILSDDYINAVHNYQNSVKKIYDDTYQKQQDKYMAYGAVLGQVQNDPNSELNQTFYKAIHDAGQSMLAHMPSDPFKSSQNDSKEIVDLDNILTSQLNELNEYAVRLINDVRTQLGYQPLVLNYDVKSMAQEIAHQYNADNRNIWDNNGHDAHAVNGVGANYGLYAGWDRSTTKGNQPFEELSGAMLDSQMRIDKDDHGVYSAGVYSLHESNDHKTTMDSMKTSIYNDLVGMLLADDDGDNHWGHTQGLLSFGKDTDFNATNPEYKFGWSYNILPNDNQNYSDHYILVNTSDIKPGSYVKSEDNIQVSSMADELTKLQKAQSDLETAQSETAGLKDAQSKADQAVKDNAAKIRNLNDAISNDQVILNTAKTELKKLETALAKAKVAKNNADQALSGHNSHVAELKTAFETAEAQAQQAKTKLDKLQETAKASKQAADEQDKVVNQLTTAKQTADQAAITAQTKLNVAQQARLDADSKLSQAKQALTEANIIASKAASALQEAKINILEPLNLAATQAQNTANTAQSTADRLKAIYQASFAASQSASQAQQRAKQAADNADQAVLAAQAKLTQVQKDKVKAEQELAAAKIAAQQADQESAHAKEVLAQYTKDLVIQEAVVNQAKRAYDTAQVVLRNAKADTQAAKIASQQAQDQLTQAESAKEAADQRVHKAQEAVQKAQKTLDDYAHASEKAAQAQTALTAAEHAVQEAQARKQAADQAALEAQAALDSAKAALTAAQQKVKALAAQKAQEDAQSRQNDYFNNIIDNTISSLNNQDNTTEVVNTDNTVKTTSDTTDSQPAVKTPAKKTKKAVKYYTLSKNSNILRKLKLNHSVRYNRYVILRGHKNLRFVKITKSGSVHKILRKMKANKLYHVIALKHVKKGFYAEIQLSKHKTVWINVSQPANVAYSKTNSRSIKATTLPKTGQNDENELLFIVLGLALLGLGTTGLNTRKRK
ncbi:SEC10/PgrA surface exclusion domain-containing protein [Lactobacillus helveticus]|uniref:SEC10/PgrA surface exclusion domain-containing protein n=1 Tax=Lactobacillus helveticus TaxID=1587 RepID=UPI00374E32B1